MKSNFHLSSVQMGTHGHILWWYQNCYPKLLCYIISLMLLMPKLKWFGRSKYHSCRCRNRYVPSPSTAVVWASCQIRTIAGCACAGNAANVSPLPWVSDPDMHHGTCVTHVPWCMPGSLTSGFLWSWWRKKTFPVLPPHAQPVILRIW